MIRKSSLFCFISALFLSGQVFAFGTPDLPAELLPGAVKSHGKSICDNSDDRVPSFKEPIGRILENGARAGCTVTLIGSTCAVSAGHCLRTFEDVHFNTPLSRNGRIQLPAEEDIYQVDQDSIVYENTGIGRDWAVMRINANEITGMLPGDVQGTLSVSYDQPEVGDIIRITGYGTANGDDVNFAQQTHTGPITSLDFEGSAIRHRADTTGGNSGSAVVDERTGKIIGIHTHGGCWGRSGANSSTLFSTHTAMQEAVRSCLQWEEDNL